MAENNAMRKDEKLAHVLISFSYTYTGDSKIPSKQISNYLAQAMPDQDGRHLEKITTYSTGYHLMPIECGLRDVWSNYNEDEKEAFALTHPELATAIALMCGGDDGKARSTSNIEGIPVQGSDNGGSNS